jgi:hypothetical protein
MNRLHADGYREAVDFVQRHMSDDLLARVQCADLLFGADPVFTGLYDYAWPTLPDAEVVAVTCWPWNGRDAVPTIVIPSLGRGWSADLPVVIAHEYGHVLHSTLGFEPEAWAVSEMAKENHHEAFAEAFACWLIGGYPFWTWHQYRYGPDEATDALLWQLYSTSGTAEPHYG